MNKIDIELALKKKKKMEMESSERARRLWRTRGWGRYGGGIPGSFDGVAPLLYLPLDDLGSGIVNLVPAYAVGSAVPTYTGASVKWAKLASGLWGQVATGIARAHYLGRDTAVGAYGGYLSEPAGVQLVTPTAAIRDMTDASWTLGATMTRNFNQVGIDGAANSATLLTGGAVAATNIITQTLITAAVSTCYAPFLKRATGGGPVRLTMDNFATSTDISGQLSSVIFTRPQVVQTQLNPVYGIKIDTNGDQVIADFNQLEALAATQFASSPMASAGAARAADVLTYPSVGNIDFTQGTAYAEISANYSIGVGNCVVIGTGGRLLYNATSNTGQLNMSDGPNIFSKGGITNYNGVVVKVANSWGGAGMLLTGSGLAPATSIFDGTAGALPDLEIGHRVGTEQFRGTIRAVRINLTQFTAAQLQAITV